MSHPAAADTVAPLTASMAKASVRGHRAPSDAMSMDLSNEASDTVDVKDSDAWYPQFSPSASLGPVKKLDEGKQSGLNALLQTRMDRSKFEERFLKPGSPEEAAANAALSSNSPAKMVAKEASAESLFNRSAKLGALLANRPSKDRLEAQNIMKAPQGPSSGSLKNRAAPTSAFAGMQAQLEASKRKDKLNSFLTARPDRDSMLKRGIVQDESKASEPRARLASAKSVLGDFMLSRPQPEQLVKQKIITDIGDLPGGFERKQENVLVASIVSQGSLEGKTISAVSCGFSHTMVLDSTGVVHVFGSGANGRLGVGEGAFGDVVVPVALAAAVFGGESIALIDAGENHSAAVTTSGKVWVWGTGTWGRLGLGNQDDAAVPALIASLPEPISRVSCGAYHTLFLGAQTQKLYACGWNKNGRCGVGRKHPSLLLLTPQEVTFFSPPAPAAAPVAAAPADAASPDDASPPPAAPAPVDTGRIVLFEAGAGSSFATTTAGTLYTWGTGSFGVLGHGDEADCWDPKPVTALAGAGTIVQAALGATHMIVATDKGEVLSWGANEKHQLGRGEEPAAAAAASSSSAAAPAAASSPKGSFFSPSRISFPSSSSSAAPRSLAAGKSHSLLVDSTGALWSWGLGARGLLASGAELDLCVPTLMSGGALASDKLAMADAAWTHSAGVTESGKLVTWGAKNNGRLGF